MPADDHPFDALKHHFELEDSSSSPVAKPLLSILSRLPLIWPFDKIIAALRDRLDADSSHRLKVMVETCMNRVKENEDEIRKLKQVLSAEAFQQRSDLANHLILDAAQRAVSTRSIERVKRIGVILANGIVELNADGDEIEELMRVAMDLGDEDVRYLRELVRIEGQQVRDHGRVTRHSAHSMWEQGFWGTRLDGGLDSIFGKLESYGLVSRIPPPNNLTIIADFQNRYVLLRKGLRFVDLAKETAKT